MLPLDDGEEKIVDLSDMLPVEGDEEQVKSKPEETIAERVKLNPRKRKKKEQIKHFDSKQTINQTSNIISTSKSWK